MELSIRRAEAELVDEGQAQREPDGAPGYGGEALPIDERILRVKIVMAGIAKTLIILPVYEHTDPIITIDIDPIRK
jgi:hypothetical protein